jgi:hypothetical protein
MLHSDTALTLSSSSSDLDLSAPRAMSECSDSHKNEMLKWPLDQRVKSVDKICIKTLDDFYTCSSGKHCSGFPCKLWLYRL